MRAIVDPDRYTSAGPLTGLSDTLVSNLLPSVPDSVETIVGLVQNCLIHVFWAGRYGLTIPGERYAELELRTAAAMLGRIHELDARPMAEERPLERRLVGNCRDFTTISVALLRRIGVPARARCGFGTYFLPGHYEDHWAIEYWNETAGRWVMVDAQLDAFQRETLRIGFDPLDVPRGGPGKPGFVTGSHAWRLVRGGEANADDFGIHDMHGIGFICGNLLRDLASLAKIELLPWDCWGLMNEGDDLTPESVALIDRVAALVESGDIDAALDLYESDERLRVPDAITSYNGPSPVRVVLANEPGWA